MIINTKRPKKHHDRERWTGAHMLAFQRCPTTDPVFVRSVINQRPETITFPTLPNPRVHHPTTRYATL